ncbi:MAG: 5'-methylthioadenosine/S-adenosylhomocysteine nucleosidase, partial [Oribacterium sinus]|nr:5'-methylthioadenosine/S-adenosylhomocysteine nucleosidase [Oribacterium sinus]
MIGIIGAMEEEVAKLQELCEDREEIQKGPYFFVKGKLSGKEVVLCKAGIGKVNAAACTQALIDRFQPSYIFNTGIAGAISPEVHILDLVISKDAVQYDVDVTRFDYPLGKVPGDKKV